MKKSEVEKLDSDGNLILTAEEKLEDEKKISQMGLTFDEVMAIQDFIDDHTIHRPNLLIGGHKVDPLILTAYEKLNKVTKLYD